jgi:4-hydroxy-tetrahydrodipicolinate reductase
MSVRVAIAGSGGRMGRALLEAIADTPQVTLATAFDIGADLRAALAAADVLVDFTRPAGTLEHLRVCREMTRAMVIGTTGFEPAQLEEIRKASRQIGIVLAPNMSLGVNTMLRLVEMAARTLGPDYDVEVLEVHHRLKVDAPSGTALKLGEVAAKARGTSLEKDGVFARHGVTGERQPGTIGFAAARGGDIVGDHTVLFAGPGERLEITHRAASRTTYAQGALRAARFVHDKPAGLYDMGDVLGLK